MNILRRSTTRSKVAGHCPKILPLTNGIRLSVNRLKHGTLAKRGVLLAASQRSTCASVLEWTVCTNVLNVGCWNYGDIQGVHYIGGHHKVPRWLTDIPQYADPEDPGHEQCGNPAFRMITEGSKHCSFGNEAYGFEDAEHISRCLNACGWITK